MLSPQDNELLCRVGPGTPMGNLFRQYWLPAISSDELPSPDCPPMRIKLLGEELIAFRTTSGAVGLMQNACPHRGASMFFGRNEEEGPALRLPRLEVRRRRQLRRHAFRAGRVQLQDQGAREGLPYARAQRHHLGLHGPARSAAVVPSSSEHARRGTPPIYGAAPRQQLDAGLGRRDGHRPRRLPARRRHHASRTRSPARCSTTRQARSGKFSVMDTEFGSRYSMYRAGGRRQLLLARRPHAVPLLRDGAARPAGPGSELHRLRADGRLPHA